MGYGVLTGSSLGLDGFWGPRQNFVNWYGRVILEKKKKIQGKAATVTKKDLGSQADIPILGNMA